MRSPHILLVQANWQKIRENLRGTVGPRSLKNIDKALKVQTKELYKFGKYHYDFAISLSTTHWRQIISRLYYAAYNVSRGVRFAEDASYTTESIDHAKIDKLPEKFPNKDRYQTQLKDLRTDRNLSDYDHTADQLELLISVQDAIILVGEFLSDAKTYLLTNKGIKV